ncbi:glycosyltransferase [Vibrio ishigakensis]|uniref:Glycosyltransferase n=1 Tax=Vibrio ishigakensis TaxID=1481914 RepID=A0A0B8NW55_9VIBR|nr:glycosyltransferase family 2 protein [Vibrio ishigakensis]GAM58790.1 glycosyltransferase [Vibrio ishigakensis]
MSTVNLNCISVVVPYYNDSQRIKKCLESILKQTLLPKEIVLIDDFSSDSADLKCILSTIDFGEVKLNYYRNEVNRNGAYSRNFGISKCQNKYIALLDADDYWLNNHLEKSMYYLEDSGGDFLYSDFYIESVCGNLNKVSSRKIDQKNATAVDLILDCPPQTNSFFFTKEVVRSVKFDESLRRHQDYQFLYDLILSDLKVVYGGFATSIYTESHRPANKRLDFDSMLSFWNSRYRTFTNSKFDSYALYLIQLVLKFNPDRLNELIENNPCLNSYSEDKIIKLSKSFSKINLYKIAFVIIYISRKLSYLPKRQDNIQNHS